MNIPAKQTKKGIPLYVSIRFLDFPRSLQTTIEPVERFMTFVSCVVRAVTQEIRTKHTDHYDCMRFYSEFVGGICGPSSDNPANVQCVIIAKFDKDVKAHMRSYKVLDSSLDTEAGLLLARAGEL